MTDRGARRTVTALRGLVGDRFTVTRLHHSGIRPVRLLLIGSRTLLGAPGEGEAETLAQRIADRVWLRERRGVDLDVLWELKPVMRAIRDGLSTWRLWRYDAVIVLSTVRDPVLGGSVVRGLQHVLDEVSELSHVLVVRVGDVPEPVVRRTAGMSAVTIPADAREGATIVAAALTAPLAASDSAAQEPRLDAAHRRRLEPDDEDARQRAVDRLGLDDGRVEHRLQQVVDLARDTFDTLSAEITIIDHARQWTLAAAGRRREAQPRDTSLCDRSIRRRSATVIADTWRVPDLRGNPLIGGAEPIRFYASYPIESIEGYRIGVLCVWDDVPHDEGDLDVAALRDLALLAEAEIISADRGR